MQAQGRNEQLYIEHEKFENLLRQQNVGVYYAVGYVRVQIKDLGWR